MDACGRCRRCWLHVARGLVDYRDSPPVLLICFVLVGVGEVADISRRIFRLPAGSLRNHLVTVPVE